MDAYEQSNICQVVAMRDEQILYEKCCNGFAPDDAQNVMSVTKSVLALLVGIAVDRGEIASVEQPILTYFPQYTVKRGEKTIYDVTLRHLLTMTAPYKYRSEPWKKVCTSEDWTLAALDLLGGRSGLDGTFCYATLGIQILAGALQNASGESLLDYANRHLFAPLQITPHRVASVDSAASQRDFLFSKAPREAVWMADPKGACTAGWGLCLSARDMAKIGSMCLARGVYAGRRVVSAAWIDAMTTPRVQCDVRFGNMAYGYLWWIVDAKRRCFAAIGDGGNVLYVDPVKNCAVAVTATFKPRVFDRVEYIQNCILPLLP